jgi:hypothetical protein
MVVFELFVGGYNLIMKFVHGVLKLWMIGLWQVPHSNQDTQMNIDFYHGTLKWWFSLKTKGLKGCWFE